MLHENYSDEIKAALILSDMDEKSVKFVDIDLFCIAISFPESTLRIEYGDMIIHDIYLFDKYFIAISTGNTHLIIRMS